MILSSRSHFLVIASAAQCALWVWRSLLSPVIASAARRSRFSTDGEQRKERLLRRLAMTVGGRAERGDLGCTGLANQKERWLRRLFCHREERSDLAFPKSANGQKRDCRAALAMTRCVIARIVAISVVRSWQTERRDCFVPRNDKIFIAGSQ